MLNLSNNNVINHKIDFQKTKIFKLLQKKQTQYKSFYITLFILIVAFAALFLPYTQNISAKGYVTTQLPEQRPQTIQAVIAGKLEKWYVMEGESVQQGDTIAYISEVKTEYFDPQLIERTAEQFNAKAQSMQAYDSKIKAIENQYTILQQTQKLKLEQLKNKVKQAKNKINIDSTDLQALLLNVKITENQKVRTEELHSKGLKSLTELQEKQLKLQEMQAKIISQENKLLNQKNELINAIIELGTTEKEYADKLAKNQSDLQTAVSDKLEATANTAKLKNQLANYQLRANFYYITAPQSGFITQTLKKGIGEIIKENEQLATIMPANYALAVQTYIKPQDIPLVQIGSIANIRFDGWPAIVMGGWPKAAVGIFKGKVMAIDKFISDNGYYRILILPDTTSQHRPWPPNVSIGTGANSFILFQNVPLWYEIWRQLNGFPNNYYHKNDQPDNNFKQKAPLKSVK